MSNSPNFRARHLMLAFDHRDHFEQMVDDLPSATLSKYATIVNAKMLVFDAALIVADSVAVERRGELGVFVDEQYGAMVALLAHDANITLSMAVERGGATEFSCEYGDRFGLHLTRFRPDLVKVLVRHNPDGDSDANARQVRRLAKLSQFCKDAELDLLVELLVPATLAQRKLLGARFVSEIRVSLTARAIAELYAGGVDPAVWKLEVPADTGDLVTLRETCRGLGGPLVRLVVLGGGKDLFETVAAVRDSAAAGFDGFAVGRTIWDEPLRQWITDGDSSTAVSVMATRYRACLDAFDDGVSVTEPMLDEAQLPS